MTTKITEAKAKQVLKSVATAFGADETSAPSLIADYDKPGQWAVAWEDGPYEWAYHYNTLTDGYTAKDEEFGFTWKPVKPVKGVWTEPIYSFVLGLYPE